MTKFSSVQVGVCKGAKRGEVCNPATCEVHFGCAARSAAQRRAKFSSARAGGRGRASAGEGAKAHDLQPCKVFGVLAWAKARRPAGPQPGVVAMCSSVRDGVGEGSVA